MKIKKGDKVKVITGKSRGQVGTIVRVLVEENKVVLDGINLVKKHKKPAGQNRAGQIIDKPMPIHASNVMLVDAKTGKPTRIRIERKDGKRVRVAVKSGAIIK